MTISQLNPQDRLRATMAIADVSYAVNSRELASSMLRSEDLDRQG